MNKNIIVPDNIIVSMDGDGVMMSIKQRQTHPFPDQLVTMTRIQATHVMNSLERLLKAQT